MVHRPFFSNILTKLRHPFHLKNPKTPNTEIITKLMGSFPSQALLGRDDVSSVFTVVFTFTKKQRFVCDGKRCWEKLHGKYCSLFVVQFVVVVVVLVLVLVLVVVNLVFSSPG